MTNRAALRAFLLGGTALALLIGAPPAGAISLTEAIRIAIDTHPEIRESLANRTVAAENVRQARADYFPTVDLSAAYGPEWSDNTTTRGRRADAGGRWLQRREATLSVNQTVFDGFARGNNVDQQAAFGEAAAFDYLDRAEQVGIQVSQAYIEVARRQEIVSLAEENLAVHESILDAVRQRVDAGQLGIGDLQQATARQANARAQLASNLRALDNARVQFERWVGQPPEDVVRPDFDDGALPTDEAGAIAMAVDNSPIVRAAASDVRAYERGIEVARADFYPTVGVELQGSKGYELDGVEGRNDDFTALVTLDYNLYRGGGDLSRSREAVALHGQSRASLDRIQREVTEDVRRAWVDMTRNEEEVQARSEAVVANSQVVATYRQEFDIGQRDLLDLLDSENELFNSQASLVTAETSALFARYRLLGAMGMMAGTLGIALPDDAGEDAAEMP